MSYYFLSSILLGKGVEKAEAALKRLGAVEPVDPGPKGSWAFAGFKGAHHTKNWVTQVTRPRYHGPAMISDLINTPAFDQGKLSLFSNLCTCPLSISKVLCEFRGSYLLD